MHKIDCEKDLVIGLHFLNEVENSSGILFITLVSRHVSKTRVAVLTLTNMATGAKLLRICQSLGRVRISVVNATAHAFILRKVAQTKFHNWYMNKRITSMRRPQLNAHMGHRQTARLVDLTCKISTRSVSHSSFHARRVNNGNLRQTLFSSPKNKLFSVQLNWPIAVNNTNCLCYLLCRWIRLPRHRRSRTASRSATAKRRATESPETPWRRLGPETSRSQPAHEDVTTSTT